MSRSKRILPFLFLILLCLRGASAAAQTQGLVVLTNTQEHYPLSQHLEILEDEQGAWTIEDVTSSEIASRFVTNQEKVPGFGFTDSAYWVRFRVRNEAEPETEWVLFYDHAAFYTDFYYPSDDGQTYEAVHTGSAMPFHTRDLPLSRFAFRLPLAPEETKTIHMRFESAGTLILPLSIFSDEALVQKTITEQTLNAFLYGILFILTFYNLVLFFYLRDNSYLYYVLFFSTILLGLMAISGFGAQYLWPNQGGFAAISARFFTILSFIFALLFATSFLRAKAYTPRLHKFMVGLAITVVVVLGLMFIWFRETAVVHAILILASCVTMIAAGLVVWRKGFRPARYYLVGWLLFVVGFILFLLTLVDILPLTGLTDGVLRLGLVVLALVLSLGLADRINVYRNEKEAAHLAAIAQRTHIAQDLHDSVTQSLYSANLFAEAGQEIAETGDVQGAGHYFRRIGAVTQQSLKEMRLFLYELRPPDVVEDGLVDALQKRLDTVEKRGGMEARLIVDGEVDYPDEISDQFFRITQEALNNVVKHAEANEVTVYLQANDIMGVKVVDDGRGFDLGTVENSNGLGLKTMQERAARIGGDFTIHTAPGRGTTVRVEVRKADA